MPSPPFYRWSRLHAVLRGHAGGLDAPSDCFVTRPACPCGSRDGRLPSRPPTQPTQSHLTCAAQARAGRQAAHRRGEVPPGRFVCVCHRACQSVESGPVIDLPTWSPRSGVVCARWASGFPIPEKRILVSRLFFASLGRSVAVLVRVGRHVSFAESPLCSSPPLPFVRSGLGSRGDGKRRCRGSALAVTSRACRLGSRAVCSARVSVDGGVVFFSRP